MAKQAKSAKKASPFATDEEADAAAERMAEVRQAADARREFVQEKTDQGWTVVNVVEDASGKNYLTMADPEGNEKTFVMGAEGGYSASRATPKLSQKPATTKEDS